ncbi:hypothetical protein RND71_015640 [Anisodus tanguticus]|uniref:Uncharacterized protein n=1 Tax=Anisodus tanguticus TaxID=243964 RepID=A0AAE1VD19_9SOLA|nr:hypothetical protein RND71_015640 [Anisodus tanguticus]
MSNDVIQVKRLQSLFQELGDVIPVERLRWHPLNKIQAEPDGVEGGAHSKKITQEGTSKQCHTGLEEKSKSSRSRVFQRKKLKSISKLLKLVDSLREFSDNGNRADRRKRKEAKRCVDQSRLLPRVFQNQLCMEKKVTMIITGHISSPNVAVDRRYDSPFVPFRGCSSHYTLSMVGLTPNHTSWPRNNKQRKLVFARSLAMGKNSQLVGFASSTVTRERLASENKSNDEGNTADSSRIYIQDSYGADRFTTSAPL